MDHRTVDRSPGRRRHGPAGALLLGCVALLMLTGCGSGASSAREDVDRTSATLAAAPTTTDADADAGTDTAARPATDDTDDTDDAPATDDADEVPATSATDGPGDTVTEARLDLVRTLGALPGITTREADCFLRTLDAAIGADATDELLASSEDEDATVEVDDAADAGAAAARCAQLDRITRTVLHQEWDASPSEALCVTMHLDATELETFATTRFLPLAQFDAAHEDVLDTFLTETGACLATGKVHDHLVASMMAGGADGTGAQCYAEARLATHEPGEALRVEYGRRTLPEAREVYGAMRGCVDVRAMFAQALVSGDRSPEVAGCIVGQLTDEDLETIVLGLITDVGLGREGADAQSRFEAAGEQCLADRGT